MLFDAILNMCSPQEVEPSSEDKNAAFSDYLKKVEIRIIFSDKHFFNLACS